MLSTFRIECSEKRSSVLWWITNTKWEQLSDLSLHKIYAWVLFQYWSNFNTGESSLEYALFNNLIFSSQIHLDKKKNENSSSLDTVEGEAVHNLNYPFPPKSHVFLLELNISYSWQLPGLLSAHSEFEFSAWLTLPPNYKK